MIDTPDLDQQLLQARPISPTRWQRKARRIHRKPLDADAEAGFGLATGCRRKDQRSGRQAGDGRGSRSQRRRLEALESFKRITAPFDGIVTARTTDIGALINAGGGTGPELFTVSDARQLRVYVSVPQDDAAAIKPGMTATLTVPERPGMKFNAKLVDTDDAITPASGTLLVQLAVDNQTGLLIPGEYTQVHFALPTNAARLVVPASSLIFRQHDMQVAVIGQRQPRAFKAV